MQGYQRIPLSREELQGRTSNNSNKASVDIKIQDVWERGLQTFFSLWVLDPNACRYRNKTLQQCYNMNEQEKKRAHNEIILQIGHDTFKRLVLR